VAIWFGACFLFYFLFDTVCGIPHNALGPELTLDYNERSSLYGWRGGFMMFGLLLAALAPNYLKEWTGDARSAFATIAAICGAVIAITFGLLVMRLRERPGFATSKANPLVPGVRRAMRNRPFRLLLITYVVFAIAGALPGLMLPFFNEYVVRPENPDLWLSLALGTYVVTGGLFLPAWVWLAKRVGKRPTWILSIAIGLVFNAAAWMVGEGDLALAIALLALAGIQFGAGFMIAPSIQADAIDYDEFYTGKRREAQYGSFWAIARKFVAIPAAAVPFAFLDWMGYIPNQPQSPGVVLSIRVLFALVPASFSLIALLVAWRFPINQSNHRAILEGIERHRRGEAAVDPLTRELVPPPDAQGLDEETIWFLDHFSSGELRRAQRRGPGRLGLDVLLGVLLSTAALVGFAAIALSQLGDAQREPTVWAAPALAGAGVALTGLCFHLLRIGPAMRFRRAPPEPEILREHLDGSTGEPADGEAVSPHRTGSRSHI
jgi:GPH family glycoside/pentoside/hexuronide:cation symporter